MEIHRQKVGTQRKPFVSSLWTNGYRKGGLASSARHTPGQPEGLEERQVNWEEILLSAVNTTKLIYRHGFTLKICSPLHAKRGCQPSRGTQNPHAASSIREEASRRKRPLYPSSWRTNLIFKQECTRQIEQVNMCGMEADSQIDSFGNTDNSKNKRIFKNSNWYSQKFRKEYLLRHIKYGVPFHVLKMNQNVESRKWVRTHSRKSWRRNSNWNDPYSLLGRAKKISYNILQHER